jgi:hypothetical protein
MSTLTGQWSLQKLGETLISSIRFGLFVINFCYYPYLVYIYVCEKPEFHTSEIEILWLEVIINNLKAMVKARGNFNIKYKIWSVCNK